MNIGILRHRPFRVLMVEDNGGDVLLMQKALQESVPTLRLDIVTRGEEALSYLKKEGRYETAPKPDMVLLDLNLPGMDGRTLLRRIKGDGVLRSLPVIVFTSSRLDSDVREAYEMNANGYLMKPGDLRGFQEAARDLAKFWFHRAVLPSDAE